MKEGRGETVNKSVVLDKENIYGGKPKPYEKSGTKAAQLLGTTFSEGLGILFHSFSIFLYYIFCIEFYYHFLTSQDIEEWMFSSEKDQKHIVFHSWDFITQDIHSSIHHH